jgi:hypothetical protein
MTAYPITRKLLPNDGGGRSARRLVVLVPDQDVDAIRFSRAIRSVAIPETADVLLVTAVNSVESELAARRRLTTIASQVRDFDFKVEVRIVWNGSWIAAAREVACEGDRIACPPEMTVRAGLRKRQPLNVAIAHRLDLPVTPLPGFFQNSRSGFAQVLLRIGYWAVIVAIVAGFFVLESGASQAAQGWIGQMIVIVLMICELGAIYLWTAITG